MSIEDNHEVAEQIQNGGSKKRKWGVIALAVATALVLVVVVFVRQWTTTEADQSLCEKLDRLTVKIETAVTDNPELTADERSDQIKFWEAFRNDEPVCRTPGP